jgi:polyhydroxybutyrate depolymerase
MRSPAVGTSIAAIVLCVIVVTGCNRNSSSHQAAPSTTASKPSSTTAMDDVAARPSKGCGTKHAGSPSPSSITFEGVPHEYLVNLPRDYDAERPAPLVFNFHGLGGSAAEQARLSGLGTAAAERG